LGPSVLMRFMLVGLWIDIAEILLIYHSGCLSISIYIGIYTYIYIGYIIVCIYIYICKHYHVNRDYSIDKQNGY
jgi:hypothetical protein